MKTISLVAVLMMAMLAVSLVAPMVAAQEDSEESLVLVGELTDEALEEDAGVTPESPIYGLERAIERIRANLAFNKEKRAELELKFAGERASEAAVMAKEGNTKGLEKALEVHERNIQRAQEALEAMESNGNEESAKEDLEATIRIQNRIEAHIEKVEAVKARILERQEGRMTEEQIAKMQQTFDSIIAKAEQKQENARTKYKAVSGKTDEEVDAVMSRVRTESRDEIREQVRENIMEQSGECGEACEPIQTQDQIQQQGQTNQQGTA